MTAAIGHPSAVAWMANESFAAQPKHHDIPPGRANPIHVPQLRFYKHLPRRERRNWLCRRCKLTNIHAYAVFKRFGSLGNAARNSFSYVPQSDTFCFYKQSSNCFTVILHSRHTSLLQPTTRIAPNSKGRPYGRRHGRSHTRSCYAKYSRVVQYAHDQPKGFANGRGEPSTSGTASGHCSVAPRCRCPSSCRLYQESVPSCIWAKSTIMSFHDTAHSPPLFLFPILFFPSLHDFTMLSYS